MDLFGHAKDFYSDNWLAYRLQIGAAIGVFFLVAVFAGLHLLRRAFGPPVPREEGEPPPPDVRRVERYELGARLYHWGNFLILLGLIISGTALYDPYALVNVDLGISWLLIHEIAAGLFILGLIAHIVAAIWRTGLGAMWFKRGDWRDLRLVARYYAGQARTVPKVGKYDVWQKIYHALLTIFSLLMIATGISLFLNAEVITSLPHGWMRWQRLIHDVFAVSFMTVILGHIYLRLLRLNWPKLAAMFTGWVSAQDFRRWHDWRRWHPQEVATDPHRRKPAE